MYTSNYLNDVYFDMNVGEKVAGPFLDLSSAFDTISHDLLQNKLFKVLQIYLFSLFNLTYQNHISYQGLNS